MANYEQEVVDISDSAYLPLNNGDIVVGIFTVGGVDKLLILRKDRKSSRG